MSAEVTDKLTAFVGIYGEMECVLQRLSPLCTTREEQSALRQLQALASLLQATPYAGNIHFDFSIVNNMKYYNGFVFKGFLRGVCQGVLAGGQYDKLMVRLGRSARAIGFALYLDLLDELEEQMWMCCCCTMRRRRRRCWPRKLKRCSRPAAAFRRSGPCRRSSGMRR